MIEWWGPIIHEYYGATEGLGFTACDSQEWLAHRGIGRPGAARRPAHPRREHAALPEGRARHGLVQDGDAVRVLQRSGQDRRGALRRRHDEHGRRRRLRRRTAILYLTDRATFMIISGGVNIYPQECENLLITHPKVADAAVFGVPNADLGEEVKAVVQAMPGVETGADLERRTDRVLRSASRAPESVRVRSTSRRSCRACPPASSTSASCATATGATSGAGSCEAGFGPVSGSSARDSRESARAGVASRSRRAPSASRGMPRGRRSRTRTA